VSHDIKRRDFLQLALAGSAFCLVPPALRAFQAGPGASKLISPGNRRSKVKVARLYMGSSQGLWPKPNLDLKKEIGIYENAFGQLKNETADVDFAVDELVTSPEQVRGLRDRLLAVDGILVIHLNIEIWSVLQEILRAEKPTMIFAVPYSGHEWTSFGDLRKQPLGARMECILSSDLRQLAVAIRPFRAIHHFREGKILNLTTNDFAEYAGKVRQKFGTEIKPIGLAQMVDVYNGIGDREAEAETALWIRQAEKVVEPSRDDIFKSAKLALAFEKLLDAEEATVMTVDCYGSMWDKTIKLPAYPCLGFARLNNMGWGGICESDLRCAMTHILFQGLAGRPGFISDPTMDESKNSIILAHCLGTPKMDGPNGPAASYKLRSVMERQEGVVPQVKMRLGQRVTEAVLIGTDQLRYFTGSILETPVALSDDRGCRTKITVKVDGSAEKLWQNWTSGLHRQTCYGDITKELGYFCRFKDIRMINEAA
jgi:hypothetical protein